MGRARPPVPMYCPFCHEYLFGGSMAQHMVEEHGWALPGTGAARRVKERLDAADAPDDVTRHTLFLDTRGGSSPVVRDRGVGAGVEVAVGGKLVAILPNGAGDIMMNGLGELTYTMPSHTYQI